MSEPVVWNWNRGAKTYYYHEYTDSQEVRISVVDDEGYPCHEQVVLPLAIWNAMTYMFVAKDRKRSGDE